MNALHNRAGVAGVVPLSNSGHEFKVRPISIQFHAFSPVAFSRTGIGLYYSAIKKNSFESVLMRWMKLEPIIQSEVSQKDKDHYNILTHIYGI